MEGFGFHFSCQTSGTNFAHIVCKTNKTLYSGLRKCQMDRLVMEVLGGSKKSHGNGAAQVVDAVE